jgi:uncharacterized membrane protein YcaP (DUF421 family)
MQTNGRISVLKSTDEQGLKSQDGFKKRKHSQKQNLWITGKRKTPVAGVEDGNEFFFGWGHKDTYVPVKQVES